MCAMLFDVFLPDMVFQMLVVALSFNLRKKFLIHIDIYINCWMTFG